MGPLDVDDDDDDDDEGNQEEACPKLSGNHWWRCWEKVQVKSNPTLEPPHRRTDLEKVQKG